MNKMEKALGELGGMDALAAENSPIHRLSPLAKLLTTITYLVIVLSFHKYDLTGLVPMLLYPILLFQLSGIPLRTCFYKLRIVLPLVLDGVTVSCGMVSMVTLMLKGVLCLMASFLLMATTSIDALCAALRQLHVPSMPVTLLLLTYRYVGVLTEELAVMTDAYHLRAPGQRGIHRSAWGSFLGQLLLRSMDRAEELYASMRLRGYHGAFYYAGAKPFGIRDGAYLALCAACFLLFRLVNVAQLLGSLFVR